MVPQGLWTTCGTIALGVELTSLACAPGQTPAERNVPSSALREGSMKSGHVSLHAGRIHIDLCTWQVRSDQVQGCRVIQASALFFFFCVSSRPAGPAGDGCTRRVHACSLRAHPSPHPSPKLHWSSHLDSIATYPRHESRKRRALPYFDLDR